jgi:hypothetical protein
MEKDFKKLIEIRDDGRGTVSATFPPFEVKVQKPIRIGPYTENSYNPRLDAYQRLRDALVNVVVSSFEDPDELAIEYGLCSIMMPSMEEGIILAHPKTLSTLRHFLKEAHHIRLYGSDEVE